MRIEKSELIAGIPAMEARRFMRRAAGFIIRPRTVTNVLGFCEDDARQLLSEFQKEGLVTAKSEFWEATVKGHALAMATAASPLRRSTAERLIADAIGRARMINRDNEYAYRVQWLAVFGSVVAGAERPNDVDVACKLVERFEGKKQRVLEDERRASKGRFVNTSEWAAWPKIEVLKKLRSRSRGLSIQELGAWSFEKIDHRVVFSDDG
jgi:hypothetical protein